MGYLSPISEIHSTYDIMFGNPSKKIRLDCQSDGNAANDDLWGQDDLTAEEFDMLEVQATQSCNQSYLDNTVHTIKSSSKQNNSEVDDLKQLQYELEGRVKLLSHSLERSSRELNEEKLNREHVINERMKEFHEREISLKKEVEKMQSILEFKEQEMKSTCSKLQVMKSQLQDRKGLSAEMSLNFDDFSKSSKFAESPSRHNIPQRYRRRHKLLVDTPKGEMKGIEILSSILYTRLACSVPSFESTMNNASFTDSLNNFNFTPVSVVHLKNEQKCDELLEYCINFLSNHVAFLKTLASKNTGLNSSKSSPISNKWKMASYSQTVISNLCDIIHMCSWPSSNAVLQKGFIGNENCSENAHVKKIKEPLSSIDRPDGEMNICKSFLSLLLESLSTLLNPKTYPNGYLKKEEMEFSLSALLSACLSCPEKFLDLLEEFPCHFLLNPHQSVAGLCTTLKLMTVLCSNKKFILYLTHGNSNCLFCLISAFLLNTVPQYPEKFATSVTLVEDFLSSVFCIHNVTELDAYNCISQVIQGIIKSMWKYFQIRGAIKLSTDIIKKGFLLLHFIATSIPNFKDRRSQVEDEYISLISGVLADSRESGELREFNDPIHTLWDFQTDISEFDLDELSEEVQLSSNKIDAE